MENDDYKPGRLDRGDGWPVLSKHLQEKYTETTGNAPPLQQFTSGATRTPSRLRYDQIPPTALRALAERFGVGTLIHGPTNWMKGIPFSAMIYHMQEHVERFKEGHTGTRVIKPQDDNLLPFTILEGDIENLAAIMWGAAALIHFIKTGQDQELDDRAYAEGKVIL